MNIAAGQKNGNYKLYYDDKQFILKEGDLLYRKGHVEFYIGNNKVVSWGRVHKTNVLKKVFVLNVNGYCSSDVEDMNIPFTSIVRFKGENK